MIQTQTIVDVVDNSGAKSLRCIKVFGGFKKRYGVLGSVIRASIQENNICVAWQDRFFSKKL